MRFNIYKIVMCLVLTSLFACQRAEVEVDECMGYLYVDVSKDASEDLVFKSASSAAVDPVLSLTVYDLQDSVVASYPDYRELQGKPLPLKVGTYKAVASSVAPLAKAGHEPVIPDARFDAPFFYGEKQFKVAQNEVSNVDIVCTIANVKVTAKFSQEIKDNFTSYELNVSNGSSSLKFSNLDGTIDNEGFFRVTGELTWTLTLVNKDGVKYKPLTETYTDVKARQHYNLDFKIAPPDPLGAGALTVIVDNSLTEKHYDLTLDFGEKTPPVVTPDFAYTENVPVEVNAGDLSSKKFTLASEDGFENIVLTYNGIEVDLVGADQSVISALSAIGIETAAVVRGAKNAEIDITRHIAEKPIGNASVSLKLVDVSGEFVKVKVDFVLRSPVMSQATTAEPWAMFATLNGKWFTESKPEGLELHYKKTADQEWTVLQESAFKLDEAESKFSAEIRGLVPGTEYEFKTTTAQDKTEGKEGPVVKFTTEGAPVLPNMSFDAWIMGDTGWFPNATKDESSPEFIWDSANTKTFGQSVVVTTPEETTVAVAGEGKKAAKLESISKVGTFAAGNIYTGNFGAASLSPLGATLKWGVPFTGRPLALKGYYHYQPKTINKSDKEHSHLKGQTDIGQIQIMLTTWSAPFDIDTANKKFVDVNSPEVIAYATMDLSETAGYQEFELKLDYRDTARKPTYIVIVGAASKYGDFFTGAEGTVLYLDEFEFVYDKDQLSK